MVVQIKKVFLKEKLLQRKMVIVAICPLSHIDIYVVVFSGVDVIDIKHRCDLDLKIPRTIGRIALVKFKRQFEVFIDEESFAAAEKSLVLRACGADGAGRRHLEDLGEIL